jgi:hypothetical protein
MSAPWPRLDGTVYRANGDAGEWFVASASTDGAYWRVRWEHPAKGGDHLTCTCPVGRRREYMGRVDGDRPCRHCTVVVAAEKADGAPKLSIVAPNISALID